MRFLVIPLAFVILAAAGNGAEARDQPTRAWSAFERNARTAVRGDDELEGAQGAKAALSGLSLDEAVSMVERRFGAKVVRADTEQADGRTTYVLRLLSEGGRVWTVRVDAATGTVRE